MKLFTLGIFILAYIFVIFEEFTKIRKSKIIIFAATLIWIVIFFQSNDKLFFSKLIKNFILEYAELFFFLFVAMIYINSIRFFGILENIRIYIMLKNFSYKNIFWMTGILSFFLSPIADNLTTALLMCSIILAIEKNNKEFITLSCINIVVAVNAGGVFSPFGDITTLMIWQHGMLSFLSFLKIFVPALCGFLITSFIISFSISNKQPLNLKTHLVYNFNKYSFILIFCFIFTILSTIFLQNFLNIPAVIGMMMGFAVLQLFEYFNNKNNTLKFNIYDQIYKIEWETLMFFYGIMLCIGSLSAVGLLDDISFYIYNKLGENIIDKYKEIPANILIGFFSAIIDNIPLTFAILKANIEMSEGQWLLVTLSTGIGGSLLSIGSAAGIALMGQAKNFYTFFTHLKWSWAIFLGYILSILLHIILNNKLFT